MATELGPSGIVVNCVVPGRINTVQEGDTRDRSSERLAEIPVGRFGKTEDIASLCAYLCSDSAGFLNGQTIHVNGGERDF